MNRLSLIVSGLALLVFAAPYEGARMRSYSVADTASARGGDATCWALQTVNCPPAPGPGAAACGDTVCKDLVEKKNKNGFVYDEYLCKRNPMSYDRNTTETQRPNLIASTVEDGWKNAAPMSTTCWWRVTCETACTPYQDPKDKKKPKVYYCTTDSAIWKDLGQITITLPMGSTRNPNGSINLPPKDCKTDYKPITGTGTSPTP
jgi:hypothetical protein